MEMHSQNDIKDAMTEILDGAEASIARIPEALFVKHFLPLLTSTDQNVNLKPWTDIAGNPLLPVHIVDPKGQILFDVPPLMRRQKTNSARTEQHSMAVLSAFANAKARIIPQLGMKVFRENFDKFTPAVDASVTEDQQWQAILERYGFIKAEEAVAPQQAKVGFSDEQDELL